MVRQYMSFPLGKSILAMLATAVVSGVFVLRERSAPKADLSVWCFADSHYQAFRPLVADYTRETGISVDLRLIQARAMDLRLESVFMSGTGGETLPDLAEIEIGSIGQFFRPPALEVGFVPLNDRLMASGWYSRIIAARFAPWSKQGMIFGVPLDVHPVALVYRDDLFQEAGIDLTSVRTWREFQSRCIAFQDYWRGRGFAHRHAIELSASSADDLMIMLLQRGINLIDADDTIHLADPIVARTLAFYATMVAGPGNIASQTNGMGSQTRDMEEGNICVYIAPDWRMADLRRYGAQLSGKMRMIPLPRFEPADAPTSTWGGTMIGIPKTSKNPDAAWKLLEQLYFSDAALIARRTTDILPPVTSIWNNPYYHQPDPYFGGEKYEGQYMGRELYVYLAAQIPTRYVTPATEVAQSILSYVLNLAVADVAAGRTKNLDARCQRWLNGAARDLQLRMKQWSFDE